MLNSHLQSSFFKDVKNRKDSDPVVVNRYNPKKGKVFLTMNQTTSTFKQNNLSPTCNTSPFSARRKSEGLPRLNQESKIEKVSSAGESALIKTKTGNATFVTSKYTKDRLSAYQLIDKCDRETN